MKRQLVLHPAKPKKSSGNSAAFEFSGNFIGFGKDNLSNKRGHSSVTMLIRETEIAPYLC
jgi:hypothetical protein